MSLLAYILSQTGCKEVSLIPRLHEKRYMKQTRRKHKANAFNIRGAFNKFQDYVLNTTTVNRTFLTAIFTF